VPFWPLCFEIPWVDSSGKPGEPARMKFTRSIPAIFAWIAALPAAASQIPHLELDLTGPEYRQIEKTGQLHGETFHLLAPDSTTARQLDPVLNAGKRNLDWLNHINARRPSAVPLSLSSPDTQMGFPVDSPRAFNVATITKWFSELRSQIPANVAAIVLDGAPFTDEPGMSDQDYINAALQVDRLYQLASRWLLLEPYLPQLSYRKKQDIRSYLALQNDADLSKKLASFETLTSEEQELLLKRLYELCFNNPSLNEVSCRNELAAARRVKMLGAFYSKYVSGSAALYASFFRIPRGRGDVTWTAADPSRMTIPFADPQNMKILNFLRDNIEDEWKWNGWGLKLDFRPTWTWGMTRVEFEPGATPHVDGIGGSTITMDANSPLTEYNVQWTIRHEYGHVLGFPDCYLEFFDSETQLLTSYQLDVTNLMCSRRGHLQQKHFDELKRIYFR